MRILNMGDEDTWIVVYQLTGSHLLKIYYTGDRGETWFDKLGNLTTLVPNNSGVVNIQYA
jgi:hypothetical protein